MSLNYYPRRIRIRFLEFLNFKIQFCANIAVINWWRFDTNIIFIHKKAAVVVFLDWYFIGVFFFQPFYIRMKGTLHWWTWRQILSKWAFCAAIMAGNCTKRLNMLLDKSFPFTANLVSRNVFSCTVELSCCC